MYNLIYSITPKAAQGGGLAIDGASHQFDGRRFAPRLGAGLRAVVSGTLSPNRVIESMSLRWVVWRPTHP